MTLVLKGIDDEILKKPANAIKAEIAKNAPFTKTDNVYIMEKAHIIKVRLRTMAMAEKIKETVLRLFWFSTPQRNIEYERYTNVPQCMVCYSYEHVKNSCPTKEKKICSECAQEGHTFRDCQNRQNPKCVNCGENHRTLSGKCKTRKEVIQRIEKEKMTREKERSELPYGTVAKNAADAALIEAASTKQVLALPNDLSVKVLVVLINAHLANIGRPGTYAEEVKKGLRTGNLPEVEVPNGIDSAAIFQIIPPTTSQPPARAPELQATNEPTSAYTDVQPSIRPKERHASISTASTTSELSHVLALEAAISVMDTDNTAQEEELEITNPPQQTGTSSKEQRKQKPVTKLLFGGIPADP